MTTSRGIVASAHALASQAGAEVLGRGGNAFDAAIACSAALQVVQPGMSGLGGDFFCLYYDARQAKVGCLNASGYAPAVLPGVVTEPDRRSIPMFNHGAAVTVPGCVDGWVRLNEGLGSLPLKELLAPAAGYCRDGIEVSPNTAFWLRRDRNNHLGSSEAFRARWYPKGEALEAGAQVVQPALGDLYQRIGEDGRDAFYGGHTAQELIDAVRRHGGSIGPDDLLEFRSSFVDPVQLTFRGRQLFQPPPNSQGMTALIALKLMEKVGLPSKWNLFDSRCIDLAVQAKMLAFQVRDQYLSDPEFMELPYLDLISDRWLEAQFGPALEQLSYCIEGDDLQRAGVVGTQAQAVTRPIDLSDTSYFAVADVEGNCVSMVQSLYRFFGSGICFGDADVVLHNRGAYFDLSRDSANRFEARKRPLHTLCAGLIVQDGVPHGVVGTMGGDGQPQTHMQLVCNLILQGMSIQEAIRSPRWLHGGMEKVNGNFLYLESAFPRELDSQLQELGYVVERLSFPAQEMGHAHGLWLDTSRLKWNGCADLRCDGGVALQPLDNNDHQ